MFNLTQINYEIHSNNMRHDLNEDSQGAMAQKNWMESGQIFFMIEMLSTLY